MRKTHRGGGQQTFKAAPARELSALSNRESSRCVNDAIRTHTRQLHGSRHISLHTTDIQLLYLALEIKQGSARDGDETLAVKSPAPLPISVIPPLPSHLFPPPSPLHPPRVLVQLGLISTRKREIAIGAGERVQSNSRP